MANETYPLYDVPWLVREANDSYMSQTRHKIELRSQTIVDEYFIERDKGTSAERAQKIVAIRNNIPKFRVQYCLRWFYQEAVRRGKITFLQKFPPSEEHIVHFWRIFAASFEKEALFIIKPHENHTLTPRKPHVDHTLTTRWSHNNHLERLSQRCDKNERYYKPIRPI